MPSQIKEDYVAQLQEKLANTPHFCLIDFDSITHQGMEALRIKLREVSHDARSPLTIRILKNSLLKVAIRKLGKEKKLSHDVAARIGADEVVEGPSALLSLDSDWLVGLQTFHKSVAAWENVVFKIGYLDNQVYDRSQLEHLATLPSREVLIAKILGSMKAPQSRTLVAMKWAMMKMVQVLRAKAAN